MRQQVVDGLAAHDHAGGAVAHGDDRRARHVVVVAREREAVGAGRGHGQQVAGRDVAGQVVGVARRCRRTRSACRPRARARASALDARGDAGRVVGAVERRAGVVAHAAVDAHVQALRAAVDLAPAWSCRPRRASTPAWPTIARPGSNARFGIGMPRAAHSRGDGLDDARRRALRSASGRRRRCRRCRSRRRG